jgi:hypothetical protein
MSSGAWRQAQRGNGAAARPHCRLRLDPEQLHRCTAYIFGRGPFSRLGVAVARAREPDAAGDRGRRGLAGLCWSGDVSYVFVALSAAVAAFGLMNAGAVAGGAWFGRIAWRRPPVLVREGDP